MSHDFSQPISSGSEIDRQTCESKYSWMFPHPLIECYFRSKLCNLFEIVHIHSRVVLGVKLIYIWRSHAKGDSQKFKIEGIEEILHSCWKSENNPVAKKSLCLVIQFSFLTIFYSGVPSPHVSLFIRPLGLEKNASCFLHQVALSDNVKL